MIKYKNMRKGKVHVFDKKGNEIVVKGHEVVDLDLDKDNILLKSGILQVVPELLKDSGKDISSLKSQLTKARKAKEQFKAENEKLKLEVDRLQSELNQIGGALGNAFGEIIEEEEMIEEKAATKESNS